MKQIEKTPEIRTRLQKAVGEGQSIDNLTVFEATALNTMPLRKDHTLFKGAVVDRGILHEMAGALQQESRPIQIMHDKDELPIGRVFHGRVLDNGDTAELRVLFFVDPTETENIAKINAGTVDQVSVSILPKHIINSASGFDYLGPDASFEHVYTGTDPDGNTIGKNGVHARLVGLEQWSEMSLVGMGAARDARIRSREESYFGSSYQKLAASGVDPSVFVLAAYTRNDDMDLKELVDKVASLSADLATKTAELAAVQAKLDAATAQITDLQAKLDAAGTPDEALTKAQAELDAAKAGSDELKTKLDAAMTALSGIAKKVLTAAGKADAQVPEAIADIEKLINETSSKLVAALGGGGQSNAADTGSDNVAVPNSLGAFRRRK